MNQDRLLVHLRSKVPIRIFGRVHYLFNITMYIHNLTRCQIIADLKTPFCGGAMPAYVTAVVGLGK